MLKWKVNGTLTGLATNRNRGELDNLYQHIAYNNDVNGEGVYGIYNRKSAIFDNLSDDTSSLSSSVDDEVFDDLDLLATRSRFQKGSSDPLLQTARGRLQTQRAKLNTQIHKELKLRSGAENLYHATSNRKLRDTVAQELSFVNSNLQLLKEELSDLNSAVDIYQHDNVTKCIPMLPFGLKETNEINFKEFFKDYILEHYSEDSRLYDKQLQQLNELRQSCRTPLRNEAGIQLLYEYYNQLHFVEKRFFPRDRQLGVVFEWYDSLTGVPTSQSTVGFERGSILFNIASLYTQTGAKQDRKRSDGISQAISNFRAAAGAFFHLYENFNFAPSMDMFPATLTMLAKLMIAQAHECSIERVQLEGIPSSVSAHVRFAQEAALVSELYVETRSLMEVELVCDYAPSSWVSIAQVKKFYFSALAHYHLALALLDQPDSDDSDQLHQLFLGLYINDDDCSDSLTMFSKPPTNMDDRKSYAKAHLRQSIMDSEEALTLHNQNKQLRRIDTFLDVLTNRHERALIKFASLEEEEDFSELLTAPRISTSDVVIMTGTPPVFAEHKVVDIFAKLGPLCIFSASHQWSVPRTLDLHRSAPAQGFGFSLRGDAPVIVASVEKKSIAQRCGLKAGDFVTAIGDVDVKWCRHDDVVRMVKDFGDYDLTLTVITPQDKNYLQLTNKGQTPASPGQSSGGSGQGSGGSTPESGTLSRRSPKKEKSSMWTLRKKRSASKEKGPKT